MLNVTVRMPPEMREVLDEIARRFEGKDRSDVIRAAIRHALPALVEDEKGALLVEPVKVRT